MAALALLASACEYDPSNATTPSLAACDGTPGTHGFGYSNGGDPVGGATYTGTEGNDVIVVTNGPVTVNGLGGNDLICVTDAFPTDAGSQIAIDGGNGIDEIIGSSRSNVTCIGEVVSACAPPTSGTFTAITYNVAGLPDVLSGSNPDVNTALIGPKLNAYDLVLLQESWLTPDPNPLAPLRTYHEILVAGSTLPFKSVPLPAPIGSDPLRPSAILSDGLNRFANLSFEPVVRQRWTNCGEASQDCLALKGFSMSRTTLAPGVTVDIYNLHMDAGGVDSAFRAENVAQLSAYIEANSEGNAVIVGGDFNLKLDREPDITQFSTLLLRGALTDACTALACSEPNRIDKFLYRSNSNVTITPTSWTNADPDFTRADGEPLSDHDPVVVDFEWSFSAPG
jgi:Endonuclease/Exonuclease/phosphatase family